MVRRVGFGGAAPPNDRDERLRKKYHIEDGNHSNRAHDDKPEVKPVAPKNRSRIFVFIIAFWIIGSMASGIGVFFAQFFDVYGGNESAAAGISAFVWFAIIFVAFKIFKRRKG